MDIEPDPILSADQTALVEQLTDTEIEYIDSLLLDLCSNRFQKVARIVGDFMQQRRFKARELPDVFLANRLYILVSSGTLEYQGFLNHMRYCEVRIAVAGDEVKLL
jgi:hypothetical protein